MPSKKASAFRKAAPSGVNEVYGSAVFGNMSSVIKPTSTVTWIMSIGTGKTRMGETRSRLASFQFPCVQAARNLSGGLGWRERPKSCGRAVTRAMRFPSVTASCQQAQAGFRVAEDADASLRRESTARWSMALIGSTVRSGKAPTGSPAGRPHTRVQRQPQAASPCTARGAGF